MTTSIPNLTLPPGSASSSPGTAALLSDISAVLAGPAFGQAAKPGGLNADYAACLASPEATSGSAILTAKTTAGFATSVAIAGLTSLAAGGTIPAAGAGATPASPIQGNGLRIKAGGGIEATASVSVDASTGDAVAPARNELSRDAIETLAALLAPLVQSLQAAVAAPALTASASINGAPATANVSKAAAVQSQVGQGTAISSAVTAAKPAIDETAKSEGKSISPAQVQPAAGESPAISDKSSGSIQAVVEFGSARASISVNLPMTSGAIGSPAQSATDLQQTLSDLVAQALTDAGGKIAGTPVTSTSASASIQNGLVTATAEMLPEITVTVNVPSLTTRPQNSAEFMRNLSSTSAGPTGDMAKIAADTNSRAVAVSNANANGEKNFLTTDNQSVKNKQTGTGIAVAQSPSNMPANTNARRNAPELPAPFLPIAVREVVMSSASAAQQTATPPPTATPAPVVAHRAVETVMNVLEAQTSRPTTGNVVNLNFNFGGDNLAVRVQLRGGEVHTQFNTSSPELRNALSNEWREMANQGGIEGLRLAEPVFNSTSSNSGHGFGSAPQGQFSSQQNPQQQTPTPAGLPTLRHQRQDANASPASAGNTLPRQPLTLPTSLHLAAVA